MKNVLTISSCIFYSKSNSLGTWELHVHVVNLTVILLHCDCPHRFEIVLPLRQVRENDTLFHIFAYMKIIC